MAECQAQARRISTTAFLQLIQLHGNHARTYWQHGAAAVTASRYISIDETRELARIYRAQLSDDQHARAGRAVCLDVNGKLFWFETKKGHAA